MFPFDFTNWLMVFSRGTALLAVFPIFSMQTFPVQMRVALGALLAFLVAPGLPIPVESAYGLWGVVGRFFVEVCIGVLMGFICRLLFFALEAAGTIIGTEMGLMLSTDFNPIAAAHTAVPAMILYLLGGMLLFALDLHHWMLAGFQRSYVLVPMGGAHLSEALFNLVVRHTGAVFAIALQMAAPVMAVSFIITLVFSVLGRAVPQMNVFSESFSVRTLAGLSIFGLSCTLMAQHIVNYLRRLPEDMLRVAQMAGAG